MHASNCIGSDSWAVHVDESKAPGLLGDRVHHHSCVQDGAKGLEDLAQRVVCDDR